MSRTYTHGMKARERYFATRYWWKGERAYNQWGQPLHGVQRKLKREKEELNWMTTPGWWHHLMHTRPWRRRVNHEIFVTLQESREEDYHAPAHAGRSPGRYRKPHKYFW